MSVKHSLLFISLAALALGGTVSAQDRDQTFRDRDTNNDDVLTQGEYGGHPGNFRSLDTNGDGVLSYQEFVRRGGSVDGERDGRVDGDRHWGFADPFAVLDRNNDGVILVNEWRGRPIRDFRDMDVNDDRRLTRAEFTAGTGQFDPSVRQRFDVLDRNDDGQVSRREAMMRDADFRRADLNDNNVLTLGEFASAAPVNYGGGGSFSALDRNNDNRISYWEWRGERETFDRIDRNNDRELSRAEFDNRPVVYGGPGAVEDFRGLDRNGDGVLSRNESRLSSYEFDRADVNNDDVLTLKEYSNTTNDNDQFDVLDRNNDGMVSRSEWNGNRDDFDRMDRNGDSVLSRSEFDRRSSGGFLGSILGRVEDVRFNDLDLNNDGVVTSSEWRGSRSEFDRLDRNNDGVVSLIEYSR